MTLQQRLLVALGAYLAAVLTILAAYQVMPALDEGVVVATTSSELKSAKSVVVVGTDEAPPPPPVSTAKADKKAIDVAKSDGHAMAIAKSDREAIASAAPAAAGKKETKEPVEIPKKAGRESAPVKVPAAKPVRKPAAAERRYAFSRKFALSSTDRRAATVVGENTERETPGDAGDAMFSISVDGEQVAGTPKPVDKKRKTDVELADVDIQVKFDGLEVKPALNVTTAPMRRAYKAGEPVHFLATWNYPQWIDAAEIRILDARADGKAPPLEILAVGLDGVASWTMPELNAGENLLYVLRVYDRDGRFDETKPLTLAQSENALKQHEQDGPEIAPGHGEDRTAFRNIPVQGGALTVYGRHVPNGHRVTALGEDVPVDADGAFVIQRIVPPGDHAVDVAVTRKGKGLTFTREVNIPSSEWFYVAVADLTAGYRTGSKHIEDVRPGEYDKVYTKGRLAFYVKGKIKGKYLLTAAADTSEDKLENLFKGLDSKDPRQFLRRIDPDDYYPVYGDDSSAIEDAPTRGKFYVRLDRGDSHVMWGNFKANINGTEFLRNERALYGAGAVYRSPEATEHGDRRTQVNLYAAQPGTLPQRDILRGTGGSAYFLKHQDVTPGSQTVNIEIRDNVTGFVKNRTSLQYGEDYDFDYFQGLVILKQPLPSSVGGDEAYLAVTYEYTPAVGDVDGYAFGGRAEQWAGDHIRFAVTGSSEKTGPADQLLYGGDILLRYTDGTYLTAEIARSEGPGFGLSTSYDGGLTIEDTMSAGTKGEKANAYRAKGRLALEDITNGAIKGDLEGYYERKEEGFSSLLATADKREENWGLRGGFDLSDTVILKFAFDQQLVADGKRDREIEGGAEFALNDRWTLGPYVRHSGRRLPDGEADQQGERTLLGAMLAYDFDKNTRAYLFGHGTVSRSGGRNRDDRIGVGGRTLLTEKVGLTAELSEGSEGIGGRALIDYNPTADDRYYLGYTLDPFRASEPNRPFKLAGNDWGAFVLGVKHNFSEQLSVFSEDSYDVYGKHRTLSQTYGVAYTPNARWNASSTVELGEIEDDTIDAGTALKNSDFDRTAVSASLGFRDEDRVTARLKGELRVEDSEDGKRDRTSYLLATGIILKLKPDWRLLLNGDLVISDASDTLLDGEYAEASLGFAYRPIDNDRFNALFKYTFLHDLPGPGQVTVNGTTEGPAQRSHIVSADVSYDVSKKLTIGAKYGARFGEIKDRVGPGGWEASSAHLAILRADLHIVHEWDLLIEGRALWTPENDSLDWGLLAGVYRHLGENVKIGVGYNFGRFSDDLRDLTHDDQGVFINVIGKL